ncbi:MAG: glycosyltransferase, partial [Rhodospirillales bacterium]|nr:glycosyltransferase [Rhodospirillales bacterium]
ALAEAAACQVINIDRHNFRHGRTRNKAAAQAHGDILLFMTQDALPVDECFIANLVAPLESGDAQATYARQIADESAAPSERILRAFNYPPQSQRRTHEDLPRLGIATFFMSNAASAIRRSVFDQLDGFDDTMICNEDMHFCARLLREGHAIAYQADARVYHTHDYTLAQQFRRYFDIGVFRRDAAELLAEANANESGLRYVRALFGELVRTRPIALPHATLETGLKWLGYQLGQRYNALPRSLCRRCSGYPNHWVR